MGMTSGHCTIYYYQGIILYKEDDLRSLYDMMTLYIYLQGVPANPFSDSNKKDAIASKYSLVLIFYNLLCVQTADDFQFW